MKRKLYKNNVVCQRVLNAFVRPVDGNDMGDLITWVFEVSWTTALRKLSFVSAFPMTRDSSYCYVYIYIFLFFFYAPEKLSRSR